MRGIHSFKRAVNKDSADNSVPSASAALAKNNDSKLSRSFGFELAGIFLLILGFVIYGAHTRAAYDAKKNSAPVTQKAQSTQLQDNSKSSGKENVSAGTSAVSQGVTTSSVTRTNADGTTHTEVTVNGQPVEVPKNGTTQQTVNTPNGATTVNVSNNQGGNSNGFSSSFTSVNSSNNTVSNQMNHTNEFKAGGP